MASSTTNKQQSFILKHLRTYLSNVEGIHLLSQHNQRSFGSLAHLLERLLELVEVDGGVVAHDADGGQLVQTLVVGGADLLALEEHLANRFVGGPGDLELVEAAVVALHLVEDEHARDGHLVGRERAGLVRANNRRAAERLHGRQRANNGVLLCHPARAQSETSRDYSRQAFRDGSHG